MMLSLVSKIDFQFERKEIFITFSSSIVIACDVNFRKDEMLRNWIYSFIYESKLSGIFIYVIGIRETYIFQVNRLQQMWHYMNCKQHRYPQKEGVIERVSQKNVNCVFHSSRIRVMGHLTLAQTVDGILNASQ